MENITEQFNAVALEYDWVTTLLEGKPDYLLDNLPDRRVSALDIGCGGGNTCIFLSSYFQHVTGIDLSADFLQIAKDKVEKEDLQNVELLQDDFLTADFEKQFDFIFSRTTFHHLDIPKALEKCKKLLKQGGILFVMDNVSEKPTPSTWTYIVGAYLDFPRHWKRFGLKNARRIFKHSTSKSWLNHLATDRYLSKKGYEEIYGKLLPGCKLIQDGWNMKVIWHHKPIDG